MVRAAKLAEGRKVGVMDTTLRDAHQSLFATRMTTPQMLRIASYLDKVGFFSMEVWGGATFDTCLRYLGEDPWERLRLLRSVIKTTPMQMLLRGQNLVGYRPYANDVVDTFVQKSVDNGIDIVRVFDALNDIRNVERSAKAVKKAGAHLQGALSYTISPVHTTKGFVDYAKKFADLGADSICIKDMAGIMSPYPCYELVKALKEEIGLPVQIHSHYTSGMSSMTYMKGVEAGASVIDCAVSTVAMGSSQSPDETMIVSFRDTEYDTGVDVRRIRPAAQLLKSIQDEIIASNPGVAAARTVDTDVLNYQIPGGMISNLRAQLTQSNNISKLESILAEVPVVRKDLGYPPLVTPMSQIVGVQASMNIMTGQRYKMISKEVKAYIKGEYGMPAGSIDPEVQKLAIGDEKVLTERPELPLEMEKCKEAVKPFNGSLEDALSYALYPDQALKYFEARAKKQGA
jgi:oxaloacetate decarboxylase alpha subunit